MNEAITKAITWIKVTGPLSLGTMALTWVLVTLRAQPWPFSDYGVFLAVGRQLHAGATLYDGVWDNKDPLIYFTIALAQYGGQIGLWVLEMGWIVTAAVATYSLSRSVGVGVRLASCVGMIAAPLITVGAFYFPGSSNVPAVALTLVALALITRDRPVLAGVALGALALIKLVALPVAIVVVAILMTRRRSTGAITPLLLGTSTTIAIIGTVLVVRGELLPYLKSLSANLTYAQTSTGAVQSGLTGSLDERLRVFFDSHVLIALIAISLMLLGTAWVLARRSRQPRSNDPGPKSIWEPWWIAVGALASSLFVLIAVAKFPHHAEVLAVPAILALVVLASTVTAGGQLRSPGVLAIGAILVLAFLLAGAPDMKPWRDALMNAQGTWQSMTETDPATEAITSNSLPGAFAVVGQGGTLPRSPAIEPWRLTCPRFAQRPWESEEIFATTLACLPTVQTILVTGDAVADPAFPEYRVFLTRVQEILMDGFECMPVEPGRICTRNDST